MGAFFGWLLGKSITTLNEMKRKRVVKIKDLESQLKSLDFNGKVKIEKKICVLEDEIEAIDDQIAKKEAKIKK